MNLTKEMAKKLGALHLIEPEELDGIQEHAEWLESIIHGPCSIWEEDDGELILTQIRQLVERVHGLKIEIYLNEHPPPHFHVKSPNIEASFSIHDCSKLNGSIDRGDLKKIKYWHKHSKELLIRQWNESRPTNCVVGEYVGT